MALMGRPGRPAVRSSQWTPASSDRNTRDPPIVRDVTQIRFRLAGSTKKSLT
jgi:hypothetical protein